MNRWFFCIVLLVLPLGGFAQPAGNAPPPEAAQFDFLIGQWDLEVTPKVNGLVSMIHGKPHLLGTWKAWRAFDGLGVDDELRVVDGSGNPVALGHAQRIFDARSHAWLISTLDVYRARFSNASAKLQAIGEMRVEGSSQTPDGKPQLTRSRFDQIGPDHFRMQQDRSSDNGASWDEAVLTIVAKRVSAKAAR